MNIPLQASNEKLEELGHNTGVDFLALKKKYAEAKAKQSELETVFDITGKGMDTLGSKSTAGRISAVDQSKAVATKLSEANAAFRALDDYSICKTCHGQGLIKEIYNHIVLQKNCPECDGDCVMKTVINISEVQAQNDKIQTETAAIAQQQAADACFAVASSDAEDPSVTASVKPSVGPNLK